MSFGGCALNIHWYLLVWAMSGHASLGTRVQLTVYTFEIYNKIETTVEEVAAASELLRHGTQHSVVYSKGWY